MAWIKVTMDREKYEALTHALIKIGFKPSSGKPYTDEIDVVWRKANRDLKNNGVCTVIGKDNKPHTITLN